MQIETVPIDAVHPDPANARRHPSRNLAAIRSSLARFGQQKPIVVDAAGVVRAGNGTLAAARALGWAEVRIVRSELAGVEATAFAIADNRTAELAEWDPDVLFAALADPLIGEVGFDPGDMPDPADVAADAAPPTPVAESFQLIVDCADEAAQRELFDRLTAEGHDCRLLTL